MSRLVIQMIDANRPEIVTNRGQPKPPGGEQAANAPQPADSSRHPTTQDAKVNSTIPALLLVMGWRYWRSHGRGHRFETVTPTT
jgi:hypothetical protein